MSITDWFGRDRRPVDPYEATYEAMEAYWRSVGTPEPDLIAHIISPEFMGGPAWPTTRQAFRVVHRANTILLASDGLSDPAVENATTNGLGLELFIESPDIVMEAGGAVTSIATSWAFEIVNHVASTVAGADNMVATLDKYGALSIGLPGVSVSNAIGDQVPARFVTADDCIGVLIGGPPPDFPAIVPDTPLSQVRIVPVVLITASELDAVRAGGDAARRALVDALASSTGHLSLLTRSDLA